MTEVQISIRPLMTARFLGLTPADCWAPVLVGFFTEGNPFCKIRSTEAVRIVSIYLKRNITTTQLKILKAAGLIIILKVTKGNTFCIA